MSESKVKKKAIEGIMLLLFLASMFIVIFNVTLVTATIYVPKTNEDPPPWFRHIIWSTDYGGLGKDVFYPEDTVYVTVCQSSHVIGETADLYVVEDKDVWSQGDVLTDVSDGVETVTLPWGKEKAKTRQIWGPPLTIGSYDIIEDVNRNGVFDVEVDRVDSCEVVAGFFVIPELPVGTLLGLVAPITALAFLASKRLHVKH